MTILAGQAFVDITVTPVDDDADEGHETLVLTIVPDAGQTYGVGSPGAASMTIVDDDGSASSGGGGISCSPAAGGKPTAWPLVMAAACAVAARLMRGQRERESA